VRKYVEWQKRGFPAPRVMAAWFGVAILARSILLALPLAQLDRLFVPDDTYYSLSIARHIAASGVPSADGVIPTNGFQPLITLLAIPFFLLRLSGDAAAYGTIVVSALAGAGAVVALGTLVTISAGEAAGWVAAVTASLHPTILGNDLSGMEASLVSCLELTCVICVFASKRSDGWVARFAMGLLFGLTVLARIDAVPVCGLCGLLLIGRAGVQAALITASGAASVLLPWAVWIELVSGAVMPESGPAVRQLVMFRLQDDLGPFSTLLLFLCTLGRIVPGLFWASLQSAFAGLAVGGAVVWVAVRGPRTPLNFFLTCCLALAAAYLLYLPAIWFLSRYLHPLFLAVIGNGAVLIVAVWQRARDLRLRALATGIAGAFLLASLWQFAEFLAPARYDAYHGFREPVLALRPQLAPFHVVAALQSGALTFYAPAGTRVVNLDGVVNRFAYRALRDKAMGTYLRDTGVQAFAEYPLTVQLAERRSSTPIRLTKLYDVPDQRPAKLSLFRLDPE
jgi:hypothetical protein